MCVHLHHYGQRSIKSDCQAGQQSFPVYFLMILGVMVHFDTQQLEDNHLDIPNAVAVPGALSLGSEYTLPSAYL